MSDRPAPSQYDGQPPVHVAGLRFFRADLDLAVDLLWRDIGSRNPHVFVLVNAQSASLRADDPRYAELLEDDRCIGLPDGSSMHLGAKWVGLGDVGRAPGPDLFSAACERAASDGTTFFLLGGREGVAESLRDELVRNHPGLRIAGLATPPHGVWPTDLSLDLARQVRESGAQVLWLGVSAPKQEIWAMDFLGQTGVPTVCVGAAFDFLSGTVDRAPAWMRKRGMEWIHRLASEPRRLWKRYLVGNVRFVAALVRYGAKSPTPEESRI